MSGRQRLENALGVDPRGLALMRIGFGCVLLADLAQRSSTFAALTTDAGLLPRYLEPRPSFDPLALYDLGGSLGVACALAAVAAVFAVMLVLGYRTRIACVGSWVMLTALHHRNPMALHWGDQILRVLLFWAMFLPLGAWASLDARRRPRSAPLRPVLSLAGAAFVFQLFLVYFFSGVMKTGADWQWGGNAVYYTLSDEGWVRPFGRFLRGYPQALAWLTATVRATELTAPFLFFAPWPLLRTLAVFAFLIFHVGLGCSLIMGTFPFISLSGLLAVLPSAFWDRIGLGRGSVDATAGADTPRGPPGWAAQVAVGVAMLYVASTNLSGAGWIPAAPDAVEVWGLRLGLSQRWETYAPGVDHFSTRHVFAATLADGSVVDLARGGVALDWRQPERIAAEFHPDRLARYLRFLRRFPEPHQRRLALWYCRQWNARHDGGRRATKLAIWLVTTPTPEPGKRAPRRRRELLLEQGCGRAESAGAAQG